ncbi:MAG: peptidoglycan-binding protein [Hyphomicrobiaceae bacterium]
MFGGGASAVLAVLAVLASMPVAAQDMQFPWSTPEKPAPAPRKPPPESAKPKPKPPVASAPVAPAPAPPAATDAGPTAPATPSAAASEAEITFWNSIKDNNKPDELRAYLKQYPSGQFAELAKLRIKEAAGAATGARNAGSGGAGTALVREVQDRLYNLNYNIVRFDGVLDADTDRAIRGWQRVRGFMPNGVITNDQLQALRAAVAPAKWGAIAFPQDALLGVPVHGHKSRQTAEAAALDACRLRYTIVCRVQAIPDPQCLAIAVFRTQLPTGQIRVAHHFTRELTPVIAAAKSLANCQAAVDRGGSPCRLIGAVCGASAVPLTGQSIAPVSPPGVQPPASPSAPAVPRPPRKKAGEQDA